MIRQSKEIRETKAKSVRKKKEKQAHQNEIQVIIGMPCKCDDALEVFGIKPIFMACTEIM